MGNPGNQSTEGSGPEPRRCPHCGGDDVITGLKINQNAEVGRIGLAYKALGPFVGTEQLSADLCRACGTVVRFFVKDTSRRWIR